MARIILITGDFPKYDGYGHPTGDTEFVVSHGIDEDTGLTVILPNKRPSHFGAYYDESINEWVMPDRD